MPPRKSTSSVTPADPDAETESSPQGTPSQSQVQVQVPAQGQSQGHITATEQQIKARAESGVNVDDHLLPRSLTIRLAKSVLPPNTTIQKDAVLAIQKAATVFVSYLSSHANDATLKRTVAPADVLSAISELEFDGFRERLEQELDAYTEIKAGKRKKSGPGAGGETTGDNAKGKDGEEEEDTTRDAKRVKRGGAGKDTDKGAGAAEDGDETQDEPENEEEDEVEEEEDDNEGEGEGDEEDEEEEEEQEEGPDDDDINRVKDLDGESRPGGTMDPDAAEDESDSEDETGPGSQLREDLGQG